MKQQKRSGSTASTTPAQTLEAKVKALQELVGTEVQGRWTPLGSTAKAENGRIDLAILNGVTTLEGLAKAVGNPATRKSDPNEKGKTMLRVKEHVHWMATKAKSHGGFVHAMGRYHKYPKGLATKVSKLLKALDKEISAQFKAQFNSKGLPHPQNS